MANNIQPYDNFWYAKRALERLEKNLMFAKTVFRQYDSEPGRTPGSTIKIKKPGGFQAVQYPTMTVQDLNPFERDLKLDQFWHVTFGIGDLERAYTGDRIIEDHIAPAMQALAEQIESSCVGMIQLVGNRTVTSGPAVIGDLTALRRKLNQRAVPRSRRFLALGAAQEEEFLNISSFINANENAAGGQAQLEGFLGRKYGFDTYFQEILPALVTSTIAGSAIVVAAATKGATTLAMSGSTLTGTAQRGMTFTIAGHTQVYAITTLVTAAGNAAAVQISPPLQVTLAAPANVTLGALTGYGTMGCAYHEHAFGMAMAKLHDSGNGRGVEQAFVTDPRTNLAIRVTRWYDADNASGPMEKMRFDALWGVTPLDENAAEAFVDA